MANLTIGTTPTHTFTVDADLREAVEIWITYTQSGKVILNKTLSDGIEVEEESIAVALTQEDTLKLMPDKPAYIQIRALTADDDYAIASTIVRCSVSNILKEGVIGDE